MAPGLSSLLFRGELIDSDWLVTRLHVRALNAHNPQNDHMFAQRLIGRFNDKQVWLFPFIFSSSFVGPLATIIGIFNGIISQFNNTASRNQEVQPLMLSDSQIRCKLEN